MLNKYVYWDTEYNKSEEKHLNLVCASWYTSLDSKVNNIWLYNNPENKEKLKNILIDYKKKGYIFISYAATAESRAMYSLRLDPTTFKQIDAYLEFRQIRNCWDKYNYGKYYVNNFRKCSVPPSMNAALNRGKDNFKLPFSMNVAISSLFGVNTDSQYKRAMRDLILTAPDFFPPDDQELIMDYCASDTKYLKQLHEKMTGILTRRLGEGVEKDQLKRAEFAAQVAIMESNGIPLHMESVKNLRKNVSIIKNEIISKLVDTHYPFFLRKKKRKADLIGRWVDSYSQFSAFLEKELPKNLLENWKRTDTNRYCADDQYLKSFDGIPELKAYREVRKILGQIKWFRIPEKPEDDLFNNIGSDGHMRTFFGIYGTQTARNAPAAKRFIFAMSAWLRCLIRPPEGYVIVELDYASQEFAIAAILSSDPNMIEAYKSGDPYLYFAKKAKAVPEDGTKATHKEQRDLFKATTLGLQYGMASKSLSVKLSADMGRLVTEREATKLIDLHKKIYRVYWKWLEKIDRIYLRKGFLRLPCGWTIFQDNPSKLSIRNVPTQGGGSSIIREAVKRIHSAGIPMTATLHDAVYIYTNKNQAYSQVGQSKIHMIDSFNDILGCKDFPIRIDECVHQSNEPWISEKGATYYHQLKDYLLPIENEEDRKKVLMDTVFS